MKNLLFTITMAVLVLFSACSSDDNTPSSNYDYLDKVQSMNKISVSTLKFGLQTQGYTEFASLLQSDVKPYKVHYYTTYNGKKIKASGAMLVSENFDPTFPTVVYTHGTLEKDEAPSSHLNGLTDYTLEVFLGMALSSMQNCVVLLPDYIGYGESASVKHPYLHGESLGKASLDFVHACAEISDNGVLHEDWFNAQLLITGYSEGGYAAVALQKAIQESANNKLDILKVIAGAGAYDQYNFAKEFMRKQKDQDIHMISTYLWVMDMYKTDFNYSRSYSDIFSNEDDALLKASGYNMGYFNPEDLAINTNPALLFKPSFVEGVLDDSDTELIDILKNNSLTDFTPADSLIFVYGTADNWVYPLNTVNAYEAMSTKGCDVKSYPVEGGDHASTLMHYLQVLVERLQAI